MSRGFVSSSQAGRATASPPTPTRKGGGGKVFGVIVVGAVLAVLAVVLINVVPNLIPQPKNPPVVNSPDEVARIWALYRTEYEQDSQNRPSPTDIEQRAGTCLAGLQDTGGGGSGNPGYGPTDQAGRGTAAWVCIGADGNRPAVAPSDPKCTPTGTTGGDYASRIRGHLVSFWFGGDGLRTDGRGCQNITPQSRSVNKSISDGPEAYGKVNADIFYIAVARYRSNDDRPPNLAAMPDFIYCFIFSQAGAPVQAWNFDNTK